MALARPPSDHPSLPTVTVALATRPAAHLRGADRRRLARHVSGAERRLARVAPPSTARARLIRRLWDLADHASHAPAGEGLALIAGGDEGRHVTWHHPVIDRIIVGPPPSDDEVVEATWGFGRLAVLRLTARGSRLVCSDGAALWEPRPPWDPLGLHPNVGAERADLLVRAALPARTPLLVAGDDRLVREFRARGAHHPVVGHLPGDHSETSVASLAALAQRTMRRSLDDRQRAAMVSLALAVDRGRAARGPDAVRAAVPGPHDVLLVERGAREQVEAVGGTVVVVPDGYLAHHDAVALVPDHRVRPTPAPRLLEEVR
jgi:hypothetical protein